MTVALHLRVLTLQQLWMLQQRAELMLCDRVGIVVVVVVVVVVIVVVVG